ALNNSIGGTGLGTGEPVTGAPNTIAFNNRAGVLVGIDTTNPVFPLTTTLTTPPPLPTLPLGVNAGVINVLSTAGFASSGTLSVQTTTGHIVVTYTGISGNSFTGVTGSAAGTLTTAAGSNVVSQLSGGAIDFSAGGGNLIEENKITHTGGIL